MLQNITEKNTEKTINIAVLIFAPMVLFTIMERIYINSSVLDRMGFALSSLNCLFWFLVTVLLLFLFGTLKTALRVEGVFMLVIGLLNHYLIAFRGSPIQPWDIYSARTALSVADNYDYSLSPDIVILTVLMCLLFITFGFLKLHTDKKLKHHLMIRSLFVVMSLTGIIALSAFIQRNNYRDYTGFNDWLFYQREMTERDGTALAFIYDLKFARVTSPVGYSRERALKLLKDGSSTYTRFSETAPAAVKKPDIIVIMNEAFSDLRVIGQFQTNEEVMPFTDSILAGMPNTVSGYMEVPVVGSNTANTEFEFLTGNSMKYLPQGSVPYQQYTKNNTENLASILEAEGYKTIAMHPYGARGWNRTNVYDLYGFDDFLSDEDFENPVRIRDYISDRSDCDKIIDIYNARRKEPLFIFNVTMQNHAAYDKHYDNFNPMIKTLGSKNEVLDNYLSLIRLSDEAFEDLISYFSASKDPVIIVFFGDHQPADYVIEDICTDRTKRFLVPFYIWTNYPSDTKAGVMTTPPALAIKVLETAGIQPSEYLAFINGFNSGKFSDEDREIVQYYEMFDQ